MRCAGSAQPQWVLEGDIKGCFDHISHEWMLKHILTDRGVLQKWLQAGYVENRTLFPTEAGTPQGGIISPTLANLTLDGLEQLLSRTLPQTDVEGRRQVDAQGKLSFDMRTTSSSPATRRSCWKMKFAPWSSSS